MSIVLPVIEAEAQTKELTLRLENLELHPGEKFKIRLSPDEAIKAFNELAIETSRFDDCDE